MKETDRLLAEDGEGALRRGRRGGAIGRLQRDRRAGAPARAARGPAAGFEENF